MSLRKPSAAGTSIVLAALSVIATLFASPPEPPEFAVVFLNGEPISGFEYSSYCDATVLEGWLVPSGVSCTPQSPGVNRTTDPGGET